MHGSAAGRQEPSVEVYRDGEVREFHALSDGGDAGFVASVPRLRRGVSGRKTTQSSGQAEKTPLDQRTRLESVSPEPLLIHRSGANEMNANTATTAHGKRGVGRPRCGAAAATIRK